MRKTYDAKILDLETNCQLLQVKCDIDLPQHMLKMCAKVERKTLEKAQKQINTSLDAFQPKKQKETIPAISNVNSATTVDSLKDLVEKNHKLLLERCDILLQ